jgi:hypothetical protein
MALPSAEKPDITMIDDRSIDRADAEKGQNIRTIDNFRVLGLTDDDVDFYENFSDEARKRVVRKVILFLSY